METAARLHQLHSVLKTNGWNHINVLVGERVGCVELLEQCKVAELEQQFEVRLQTLLTHFTGMDELSRSVLLARRHIEEEILNTRCPRCRAVFADFDGWVKSKYVLLFA